MYIERSVFTIKSGAYEEIFELLKHYLQDDENEFKRVLMPTVARPDTIVLEWEWDNLAALEKYWNEWSEDPETAGFLPKWQELITGGVSNEVWKVME